MTYAGFPTIYKMYKSQVDPLKPKKQEFLFFSIMS